MRSTVLRARSVEPSGGGRAVQPESRPRQDDSALSLVPGARIDDPLEQSEALAKLRRRLRHLPSRRALPSAETASASATIGACRSPQRRTWAAARSARVIERSTSPRSDATSASWSRQSACTNGAAAAARWAPS